MEGECQQRRRRESWSDVRHRSGDAVRLERSGLERLLPAVPPAMLAALLYLGAGVGLVIAAPFTPRRERREAPIRASDVPLLAGIVITGGFSVRCSCSWAAPAAAPILGERPRAIDRARRFGHGEGLIARAGDDRARSSTPAGILPAFGSARTRWRGVRVHSSTRKTPLNSGPKSAAVPLVHPADRRYVVIIDDEDDIREIAALSLEMTEGWRVAGAPSFASGIPLARASQPDAILLDVMMPDMDGPSCLIALRADPTTRDIPVIFLTAKVHKGDLRKFMDLGVQGVIAKPFDPVALGAQIRKALAW